MTSPSLKITHAVTEDGESTSQWAFREPGFFGSINQLLCCARCGDYLRGGKGMKRKTYDMLKPTMHFLCDECFDQLPE